MAGGFRDFLRWALGWKASPPPPLANEQKTLGGIPTFTLTIGSETLATHLLAYHYEEISEASGYLAIWLDNRDDRFDDLASDFPTLTRGATVTLSRGLVINGAPSVEPLPRCWVEDIEYTEDGTLLLTCIDWQGRLEGWRYSADTEFSSQIHSAIATSILGEVSLTLASGSFGYSTNFSVSHHLDGDEALQDLMTECHEALYSGLAGEIKWKQLLPAEASGYTYDFANGTTEHPLLPESRTLESSARFNKVTVNGGPDLSYTGTATYAAEIALTGQTRLLTVDNGTLSSNAECLEQAEAMLHHEQAKEISAVLVARPHFTLELYTIVSVAAPPWGGPAVTGRVIELIEDYDIRDSGRAIVWEQEITLGSVFAFALESEMDSGRRRNRRRRKSRRRRRRRSRRSRRSRRTSSSGSTATDPGITPIGGIIMFNGATAPTGWALCDGNNGTPDLRDRFIVAAGPTYAAGSSGGVATINLLHSHGAGSLAAASDSHSHGNGSLATDSDSHTHGPGTLNTDNDAHTHGPGPLTPTGVENNTLSFRIGTGVVITVADQLHNHPLTGVTASDSHDHNVNSGVTASDNHSHGVTGSTASDSHSHDVTGATETALSATQDILPPYYAVTFIMRIS